MGVFNVTQYYIWHAPNGNGKAKLSLDGHGDYVINLGGPVAVSAVCGILSLPFVRFDTENKAFEAFSSPIGGEEEEEEEENA